ncbi:hypothetical protein [Rhizobium redzepovicii]|uniref:hypothetical protein n=1 Tax=Rhizobium redzepovicii TaxID=2867518 RepID=UPI001C933C06|nr:hypothetical protein [Rhizobium redzepovicii]MBY4616147.1 hypothetical protein [Rhizobium redzepovicii]
MPDLDDLDSLRKRYIGAEPLSGAAAGRWKSRFAGLHLYDATGEVLLRDALPTATWTEIGVPWIDRAILGSSKFEGAKIYTWFQFTRELGGFAPEIDFFLRSRDLASRGGWQIILLRSGALKAVCTKYTTTEELLSGSPEWRKFEAWIICLDHDFLYDSLALFAAFPLGLSDRLEAALGHLLRLMVYWPKGKYPEVSLHDEDVPGYLRNCLASKSEIAASLVDTFVTCTDSERSCLETLLKIRSTKEFLDLYGSVGGTGPEFEKRRSYLLQASKSMMFHFLAGHELGHYLTDNRKEITNAAAMYKWVDTDVLKGKARPRRTVDECCSDIYGVLNCTTQAARFELPVTLAVSAVDWIWLFAATRAEVNTDEEEAYWQMLKNRRLSVYRQWRNWASDSENCAATRSEDIFHLFYPALPHIRAKLDTIYKINASVTGGDDPPRRLLSWIY